MHSQYQIYNNRLTVNFESPSRTILFNRLAPLSQKRSSLGATLVLPAAKFRFISIVDNSHYIPWLDYVRAI